jgi:hypothetical protein
MSCKKGKEEIPFNPQNYKFLENEFIGVAKSYNSEGLISSNVAFNEDLFYMYPNVCYFMKSIEINSESLATFHYIDKEDSITIVNYLRDGTDIAFNRISETDPIPPNIHFIENKSNIKATGTGIRFVLNESLNSYLFFGEMSKEYLQTIIDNLKVNETIYIQSFNVIYEQK